MAPSISAEAARPVQKPQHQQQQQQQARRPVSRIVPAIPHRLARKVVSAARPVTPEESHKGPLTQPKQDSSAPQQAPQPAVQEKKEKKEEKDIEQPVDFVTTPLTPESKASVEKPDTEAQAEAEVQVEDQVEDQVEVPATALASSPAKSQDEEAVLQVAEAPGPESNHESKTAQKAHEVHQAPPTAAVDTKPLTNGVHRKELPPPFVPSSMSGMNTPVAEHYDNVYHPARPSVDGAVGGFLHDSPAPPATPHGYEAGGHGHRQSVPRIPPGFAPPDFTPSFFPGHSHHPSDAGAPWLYPPYSMPPPPEQIYGNGSDFQSPPFAAGPSAYPDPYQGNFSPEDPRFATNGVATSHSQSPGKSQFGEPLPVTDRVEVHHAQPQQNSAGPRNDDMIDSPFELASYLSTQFGNPEFADFVLQVRSPEFQYISIPIHGIVVVRSPVIANAVRRSIPPAHRSRDSRRLVDVLTTNPFVGNESIQEAIKVLYGAPLLSMQTFLYGLGHHTSEVPHPQVTKDARRRTDQLLSYIAAGNVLQIPSMQARGVEIAKALLRWDTVDQILHYGLHAARTAPRPNPEGAEVHDPFATELLNSAIDFIAYNFPADFNLYRIASELRDDPRLPSLNEARASSHNPRLSKIRFGDAPTDDDSQVNPVSRTLSSILLSLPLPLLDRLFNHRATANQIGWTGAAKVLHDVVDERENRRQKAAQGQLQLDSAAPSALMDNLYIEERVEHVGASPLHPSGYALAAHRANGQV